jgi:hypothetical protein
MKVAKEARLLNVSNESQEAFSQSYHLCQLIPAVQDCSP